MAWITKGSDEQYKHDGTERQYTKKELAANWWHYHKWFVVIGVVAVVALVWIVKDTVLRTIPDYRVGYVGLTSLPVDTSENLQEALAAFGEDVNGDGKVVVQLNQYEVNFDQNDASTDAYMQMAGVTRLSADLADKHGNYIFILENPESFEENTAALARPDDGTMYENGEDGAAVWQELVYPWENCPVLTTMDLGDYRGYTLMDNEIGSNQSVLANLYIGRRGYGADDKTDHSADEAMWQALTAGATK